MNLWQQQSTTLEVVGRDGEDGDGSLPEVDDAFREMSQSQGQAIVGCCVGQIIKSEVALRLESNLHAVLSGRFRARHLGSKGRGYGLCSRGIGTGSRLGRPSE